MNNTVLLEPRLGVVRIFDLHCNFFKTRESTLVVTGWTLSYILLYEFKDYESSVKVKEKVKVKVKIVEFTATAQW